MDRRKCMKTIVFHLLTIFRLSKCENNTFSILWTFFIVLKANGKWNVQCSDVIRQTIQCLWLFVSVNHAHVMQNLIDTNLGSFLIFRLKVVRNFEFVYCVLYAIPKTLFFDFQFQYASHVCSIPLTSPYFWARHSTKLINMYSWAFEHVAVAASLFYVYWYPKMHCFTMVPQIIFHLLDNNMSKRR